MDELELDFSEQGRCTHVLGTLLTSTCDSMLPLVGTVKMYALTRIKKEEMTNANGVRVRRKKYY